jgi:hypothetical protein
MPLWRRTAAVPTAIAIGRGPLSTDADIADDFSVKSVRQVDMARSQIALSAPWEANGTMVLGLAPSDLPIVTKKITMKRTTSKSAK